MSVRKKEALVVLILIGVLLFMGGFFLNVEKNNNLTGAAIATLENTLAIPPQTNSPDNPDITNTPSPSTEKTETDSPHQESTTNTNQKNTDSTSVSTPQPLDIQLDNSLTQLNIQEAANQTQCGVVNGNITLRRNVNSSRTCFHINASNIVIDCAGYMINYTTTTTNEENDGYGINNTGFQNITIKSCRFLDGNTTNLSFAIDFRGNETSFPFGGFIFNNTFVDGLGINITDANLTNITSNEINVSNGRGILVIRGGNITVNYNTIRPGSDGIHLVNSKSITLEGNNISRNFGGAGVYIEDTTYSYVRSHNITGSRPSTYGIQFETNSSQNSVSINKIRMNGSSTYGIRIGGSSYNTFFDNDIYTNGVSALAIWLAGSWNVIANNNLSANLSETGGGEFRDSGGNNNDSIVYNNSFGKIEWLDNGTGGFFADKSSQGKIGYAYNFFMTNNSLAFNGSGFLSGAMNNSPRKMTLYNLPFRSITQIFRLSNISTDEAFIRTSGTDCAGNGCTIVGAGAGKYIFNTSLLGSFALNGTALGTNTPPNTTQLIVNASTYLNHTDDILYCRAKGQDNEQTLLDAYWTWYKNGIAFSTGITTINNGTLTTLSTINPSDTERLDEWNCSVYMYDGYENETDGNNASLKISSYLCGEYIASSFNLTANVAGCTGNGLGINTNGVILNCNHKLI